MHIVFVAWLFVVLLMTLTEATSTQGSLLGAFFTFLLYGVLPLAIVMYLLGTPARRRARRRAEAQQQALADAQRPAASATDQADTGGHAAAAVAVTPEREKL